MDHDAELVDQRVDLDLQRNNTQALGLEYPKRLFYRVRDGGLIEQPCMHALYFAPHPLVRQGSCRVALANA